MQYYTRRRFIISLYVIFIRVKCNNVGEIYNKPKIAKQYKVKNIQDETSKYVIHCEFIESDFHSLMTTNNKTNVESK